MNMDVKIYPAKLSGRVRAIDSKSAAHRAIFASALCGEETRLHLLSTSDDIEAILHTYGDMLFRLCLVSLGNASDAEDAVQETMLRYLQKAPVFQDAEHRKAWLLTVAANKCRDMLRHRSRHPAVDIDEIKEFTQESSDSGILDTLMTLPEKYRTVIQIKKYTR